LKQAGIGVLVGIVAGYFAALLIAHEKLDFLAEYTPLVTLMAVIGAYLGADGFQACGFMAVFVFGLMNKHLLGGVFVVTVFMFVARPITIFCCALPDKRAKWSMNELLFMC
jgi:cell volume regulation protein A